MVVPSYDDQAFLRRTLPAFLAAVDVHGRAELVLVDNGSTEPLSSAVPSNDRLRMVRVDRSTIGGARNAGAAVAAGRVLVFCDADCLVPADHLVRCRELLAEEGVAAVGNDPRPVSGGSWIESAWHALHAAPRRSRLPDRDIPAANLAVTATAFRAVGGFDPELMTGEDAELCQRLRRSGHRLLYTPEFDVVHLGVPRTVGDFFRRNVWHGLGMFGTARGNWLDKPTVAMLLHILATAIGLALFSRSGLPEGAAYVMGSQVVMPLAAVLARCRQSGGCALSNAMAGIFLYWVYLWARALSLLLIGLGRDRTYRGWSTRRRGP